MRCQQDGDLGFSLVEVLVALVIVTVSLVSIYRAVGGAYQAFLRSGIYDETILLSRSLLAEVGADGSLSERTAGGRFKNGVQWHLEVEGMSTGVSPSDTARPYWVEITTYDRNGKLLTKLKTITLGKLR